jgi:hypothetical protein
MKVVHANNKNVLAALVLWCWFANNPIHATSTSRTTSGTRTTVSSGRSETWEDHPLYRHQRDLADNVTTLPPPEVPPTRTCGQVVTLATIDQIKAMTSAFIGLFLPANTAALALTTINNLIL